MRHLYEVYIVNPEKDLILGEYHLIAKSGSSAKIKALAKADLDTDIDDLDIIVVQLGDISDKKEIQEVRIIEK